MRIKHIIFIILILCPQFLVGLVEKTVNEDYFSSGKTYTARVYNKEAFVIWYNDNKAFIVNSALSKTTTITTAIHESRKKSVSVSPDNKRICWVKSNGYYYFTKINDGSSSSLNYKNYGEPSKSEVYCGNDFAIYFNLVDSSNNKYCVFRIADTVKYSGTFTLYGGVTSVYSDNILKVFGHVKDDNNIYISFYHYDCH